MALLQPKQILKILGASIKITGVGVSSGQSSINVTTAITTACTVAGDGGQAVSLINSTGAGSIGVVINPPTNRVEIWDSTTKQKIGVTGEAELYGRLTYASSVYTLSFYYLDSTATEQPFIFTANSTIDFDFIYRFSFNQLPTDSLVAMLNKNVYQDPRGSGATAEAEILTVTAVNTITSLSNTPVNTQTVRLFVNGKMEHPLGVSPDFTISNGVNITWNQANAGYSLSTTDEVIAMYFI